MQGRLCEDLVVILRVGGAVGVLVGRGVLPEPCFGLVGPIGAEPLSGSCSRWAGHVGSWLSREVVGGECADFVFALLAVTVYAPPVLPLWQTLRAVFKAEASVVDVWISQIAVLVF